MGLLGSYQFALRSTSDAKSDLPKISLTKTPGSLPPIAHFPCSCRGNSTFCLTTRSQPSHTTPSQHPSPTFYFNPTPILCPLAPSDETVSLRPETRRRPRDYGSTWEATRTGWTRWIRTGRDEIINVDVLPCQPETLNLKHNVCVLDLLPGPDTISHSQSLDLFVFPEGLFF